MKQGLARLGALAGLLGAAALLPLACGSQGQVVFGVKSELAPGADLTELAFVLSSDGVELDAGTLSGSSLAFPLELDTGLLDDGAPVEIALSGSQGGAEVIRASGRSTVIGGAKLLYEIALETECVGVSCDGAQTCEQGTCVNDARDAATLPAYFDKWAGGGGGGDRCEPGGAPQLTVGSGQADYHAVADGDVLQVEAGPQGGYHVWVAARLKNLKQSGSVTDVSGTFATLGYSPPPMAVVFTFDPDEGDYCKIFGLRFRLDDTDHPIESLFGQDLTLSVKITDKDGDVAEDSVTVKLSDAAL